MASIVGLAGCTTSAPQPSPEAAQRSPEATKSAPPVAAPKAASPVAATNAASPAASPMGAVKTSSPVSSPAASPIAVNRAEPKGKITYAFHTGLSPAWLDPQENPALITPYCFQYALHDALVKHMPGQPFAPSLAESYEIAPDFKSATFKLRDGIKFHDGTPVTSEDVKFTYENYRGANAKILKSKTEKIDLPDARTVKFTFKEPFLDFLVLYGSPATGAGWVIPKKYYEQVGPDGFKQKPIGAGPYKFVRQSSDLFEFEAFPEYWRKTPHVKSLVFIGVAEEATRVAQLQTGEIDFVNSVPGQLVETVRNDPKLTLAPVLTSPFWIEFVGFEQPDSPFHDKRVRQAVSLAMDRQAFSDAESAGLSQPAYNWIPADWPGAIDGSATTYDPVRARQLMADAGFPNGFDVEQLTPLPPFFSLAERVITSLREIGIRTKLNTMERAVFITKTGEGPGALNGLVLNVTGAPGDAASRIRAWAICGGSNSRTCLPEIDEPFARYEKSVDPKEREQLLTEIQQYIIDNYVFVPIYRSAFINAQGPRIANNWEEIIGSVPQYVYVGPYEDVRLKE